MSWEHRVTIAAPVETIMSVLTDIESWPEWNTACKHVQKKTAGPIAVGSEAIVTMDGTPTGTWRITRLDPDGFTWETNLQGVHTVADHRVIPGADGTQEVVLSVEVKGMMAKVFKPFVAKVSNANLPREAAGLKERSEGLVAAG